MVALTLFFRAFIFGLLLSAGGHCFADIEKPARQMSEVSMLGDSEKVVQVKTAHVVLADYHLLKKDFPFLKRLSPQEIDHWLLKEAGYISTPQAAQSQLNSEILRGEDEREAFRPPGYGRALVFAVHDGLIDGKGFGAVVPRAGGHTSGLATLGEVLREFVYQKMVQKILDHSHSGFETVGSYAVIDWGFSVKHEDGSLSPAGGIFRQAHMRYHGYFSLLDDSTTKQIELILRKYGVTSAGAYRYDYGYDRLNIQGTNQKALIDFGGYLVVQDHRRPAFPFYGNRALLVWGDPGFKGADPEIRVPFELWGTTESGKEDPKYDNVWIAAHRLAEALQNKVATRSDVDLFMQKMLEPIAERLRHAAPRACQDLFISAPVSTDF